MKVAVAVLVGFLLSFGMTLADWVLEVQLHNYTNPTNALYEELNRQYCCCENCKGESSPFCNEELSHLNCTCPTGNTDNCDLQLQVCSQYSRSIEKQCYSTDQLKNVLETEFVLEGASFTYDSFEVLTFEGYHQPDNREVNLIITTYDNDKNVAITADEFDILIPFNMLYTFPPPESYQSRYKTSWITFSYRFYCIEGYYGQYCSKYCVASNDSSTGHYMCDCEGNKLCLPGYTDPTNNCIQESISSTYSSTATSSDSTVVTVTVTSNVTCTPAITCTNSSTQFQTWQGTAFLFIVLFALSVGIIIGICSVGIVKCIINNKRRRDPYLTSQAVSNPSYRDNTLQYGQPEGVTSVDISNQLYSDRQRLPTIDNQYQFQGRPPAEIPVEINAVKLNYENVMEDENETYDKIKRL